MSLSVGLEGVPDLDARLAHARDGILDLTGANRDASKLVDRQATADAPRASGSLAGSSTTTVSKDGWGVAYGELYAGFVHWGTRVMRARPWLLDAARRTEATWMDDLTEHIQQLLD